MKIKINIPEFGERFCSNNIEYKLSYSDEVYIFYKKGTCVKHNEYGPAIELKNQIYAYYINNQYHRLSGYAYCILGSKYMYYYVIGKSLGGTKEHFVNNLASILIPKKY